MALYSRLIADQSHTTDVVYALILHYPAGVTVKTLMQENAEFLKNPNSVLAAIGLLSQEEKIREEKSTGHAHHLDSIRVYPITKDNP